MRVLLLLTLSFASAAAQEAPSRDEARRIFQETADLMEAAAIVTPELARAGAPLTESVRLSIETLDRGRSREHVGVIYSLLRSGRVYIQLADALPKAAGFSEDAREQLQQLRVNVDRLAPVVTARDRDVSRACVGCEDAPHHQLSPHPAQAARSASDGGSTSS